MLRVAYREAWLQVLVSSRGEMQRGCGPAWIDLATLLVIMGKVANLQLLEELPAVDVAVLIAGTSTYVLITLGEVELQVSPYDDQAHPTTTSGNADLKRSTRLLLDSVLVRGAALARPASA